MTEFHPLVALAREAIERRVRDNVWIEPPRELPPELQRQAGAFVTIHRHGRLRGCIGTIQPTCENLALEVIQNAISAAERDPRFPPMAVGELEGMEVKVDVLGEAEPVDSLEQLDPKRYGLIVESKRPPFRRGLLLPDLKDINTVEEQVYFTRYRKAGITDPDEPVQMFRFEVTRYT